MEIFLHIGHFKTGTTSFQKFMSHNRAALLEAGIYYPEGGAAYPHLHGAYLLHYARYGETSVIETKLREWSEQKFNTLVLSTELLSLTIPGRGRALVELLRAYGNVHIIYALRDWQSYLPSRFQQNIKVNDGWTWDAFLQACAESFETNPDMNYAINVKEYAGADVSRFSLLYYDRDKTVSDILSLVGAADATPEAFAALPQSRDYNFNPSLPADQMEVTRIFNDAYHAARGTPNNGRFTTNLTRTDLTAPAHMTRKAFLFLKDHPAAAESMSLVEASQAEQTVLTDSTLAQWQEALSATLKTHTLPQPPKHWQAPLRPEFHNGVTLTFTDLVAVLRQQVLAFIET